MTSPYSNWSAVSPIVVPIKCVVDGQADMVVSRANIPRLFLGVTILGQGAQLVTADYIDTSYINPFNQPAMPIFMHLGTPNATNIVNMQTIYENILTPIIRFQPITVPSNTELVLRFTNFKTTVTNKIVGIFRFGDD